MRGECGVVVARFWVLKNMARLSTLFFMHLGDEALSDSG
jgi:hypothetical protein